MKLGTDPKRASRSQRKETPSKVQTLSRHTGLIVDARKRKPVLRVVKVDLNLGFSDLLQGASLYC